MVRRKKIHKGCREREKNTKKGDDRSCKLLYPAVQGQALKIALSSSNDEVVAPTNIRAIYVVLDKQNAVESAPSELNAWNSYTYTGLNTVVEGTSTEASSCSFALRERRVFFAADLEALDIFSSKSTSSINAIGAASP